MKNSLADRTHSDFKHLIGKRIQFIDKHGKTRIGILDFAGINTKLHNTFQVTINRTPIWPVDPKTIKEYKG